MIDLITVFFLFLFLFSCRYDNYLCQLLVIVQKIYTECKNRQSNVLKTEIWEDIFCIYIKFVNIPYS